MVVPIQRHSAPLPRSRFKSLSGEPANADRAIEGIKNDGGDPRHRTQPAWRGGVAVRWLTLTAGVAVSQLVPWRTTMPAAGAQSDSAQTKSSPTSSSLASPAAASAWRATERWCIHRPTASPTSRARQAARLRLRFQYRLGLEGVHRVLDSAAGRTQSAVDRRSADQAHSRAVGFGARRDRCVICCITSADCATTRVLLRLQGRRFRTVRRSSRPSSCSAGSAVPTTPPGTSIRVQQHRLRAARARSSSASAGAR